MPNFIVAQTDHYKDTDAFTGPRGPEFGLYRTPEEYEEERDDYQVHIVAASELGFLDILAVRYFGEGNETAWRAIAIANAMIDPEVEMFVGQRLLIPPRSLVIQFESRQGIA